MAGYLGASPVPQTIQKKQSFTATASQTTFTTTGYTDGQFINVYLNGVRLINGTDYTATNGSDIVLTSAASASDVLDFETFNEFTLVDQTLETPTFRTSATLKNDTEEDTDGGRESTLIFKGEQSGGEISTLAQIQASHDGTSDDQKGDLIFKTNDGSDNDAPTERLRIDSAGDVDIGTATGTGKLRIQSSGNAGLRIRQNTAVDRFNLFVGDGTGGYAVDENFISSNNTNLRFLAGGSGTTEIMQIRSGGGITFNGDTAAANALDDYEEGLHQISVSSGGVSFNSLYDDWRYTKIGRLVNVEGLFLASSSGDSNTLLITLPFAYSSKTAGTADSVMGVVGSYQGPMGSSGLVCAIGHGSSTLAFRKLADNAVWTTVVGSDIDSGDHLYINITYPTG